METAGQEDRTGPAKKTAHGRKTEPGLQKPAPGGKQNRACKKPAPAGTPE